MEAKRNMDAIKTVNTNGRQKLSPNSRAGIIYKRFEFTPMDEHTSKQLHEISVALSEILRLPLVLLQILLVVGYQCQQIYEQMLREIDNRAEHAIQQHEQWRRRVNEIRDRVLMERLEEKKTSGIKRCLDEESSVNIKKDDKNSKRARKESCQNLVPQPEKNKYPKRYAVYIF